MTLFNVLSNNIEKNKAIEKEFHTAKNKWKTARDDLNIPKEEFSRVSREFLAARAKTKKHYGDLLKKEGATMRELEDEMSSYAGTSLDETYNYAVSELLAKMRRKNLNK